MKEDQNIESVNDLQKEIEKEYEPMINLSTNLNILINNLLPIIKLNESQYEKIFLNVDEEITKRNKELEELLDDLNTNMSKYKTDLERYKSDNELNISKIADLEEKMETLSQEKFKLKRKLNAYPPMPLLIVEGYAQEKPIEQHECLCVICGKTMKEISHINENNDNNGDNKLNKEEEKKIQTLIKLIYKIFLK